MLKCVLRTHAWLLGRGLFMRAPVPAPQQLLSRGAVAAVLLHTGLGPLASTPGSAMSTPSCPLACSGLPFFQVDVDDLLDDPELERLHAERLAALQKEAEKRAAMQQKGHGARAPCTAAARCIAC